MASHFTVSPVMSGNRIAGYDRTEVGEIGGQFVNERASEIEAGSGKETKQRGRFLCDLGDSDAVQEGDRLVIGEEEWLVIEQPMKFDAEPLTSHAIITLERVV
ncbi:MAG: hypothetical protein R2688_06075 [Fimbriimonadaceae bacterium]